MPNFNPKNPTKFLGTNKYITFFVSRDRQPTGADYRQPETGTLYSVGTVWQVGKTPTTGVEGQLFMLTKIVANVAFWEQITNGGVEIISITTDSGAPPVLADANGNFNLLGGVGMDVTGNGPGNTATVTLEVPVTVPHGGTGRVSDTAYAVICGGTTSTDPQQSIASVGTSQQVLTSTGPGQLPVMATPDWSILGSATASNSASITFLNLPNQNGLYFFSVKNYRPGTNNVTFLMDMSSDGGATWVATGFQSTLLYNAYDSTTNVKASSTASVVLGDAVSGGGTSNCGSCWFYFSEIGNAISTLSGHTTFTGQANVMQMGRIGSYVPISPPSTNYNSFRFRMSSGNITIGDFTVYKVLTVSPV